MQILVLSILLLGAMSTGDKILGLLTEFSNGGSQAYHEVCPKTADKHLRFVCDYIGLRSETKRREFLSSAPKSKKEAKPLWEIDSLAFGGQPTSKVPAEFRSGFGSKYVEAMYNLAATGEVEAVKRFWVLYDSADGGVAEEVQERLLKLFVESPKVVVANWHFFRPKKDEISFDSTSLAPSDLPKIEAAYKTACTSANRKACDEIVALLKTRVAEMSK